LEEIFGVLHNSTLAEKEFHTCKVGESRDQDGKDKWMLWPFQGGIVVGGGSTAVVWHCSL
jgi:hypothetical protein